jgi:glycosyltransferase involved in cell wall biosynthesis
MARACPVLVPHQGPFVEFVEVGLHGETYQVGNPKEAAKKIMGLIEDPQRQRRLGLQAREYILQKHGVFPSIGSLADLLSMIVEGAQ